MMWPFESFISLFTRRATGVNRVTSPIKFLICGFATIIAAFLVSSSFFWGSFMMLGGALNTFAFCRGIPGSDIPGGGMFGGIPGGRSILGGGIPGGPGGSLGGGARMFGGMPGGRIGGMPGGRPRGGPGGNMRGRTPMGPPRIVGGRNIIGGRPGGGPGGRPGGIPGGGPGGTTMDDNPDASLWPSSVLSFSSFSSSDDVSASSSFLSSSDDEEDDESSSLIRHNIYLRFSSTTQNNLNQKTSLNLSVTAIIQIALSIFLEAARLPVQILDRYPFNNNHKHLCNLYHSSHI